MCWMRRVQFITIREVVQLKKEQRVALVLLVVTMLSLTSAQGSAQGDSGYFEGLLSTEYLKARVISVEDIVEHGDGFQDHTIGSQLVELEISQGQFKGTIINSQRR